MLLTSSSQTLELASDGILNPPLGEREKSNTFTPSGKQERLKCCAKNLL